MRKILSLIIGLFFVINISQAVEKFDIDKQLVGVVGAIFGTVKTEIRELKAGDKIYLNETVFLFNKNVLSYFNSCSILFSFLMIYVNVKIHKSKKLQNHKLWRLPLKILVH